MSVPVPVPGVCLTYSALKAACEEGRTFLSVGVKAAHAKRVVFHGSVCSWKRGCLAVFGQCEVGSTAPSFCACLTEMGVMPEIAQAVEEMDWL